MALTSRLNQELTVAATARLQRLDGAARALDVDLPALRDVSESSLIALEEMSGTLSDVAASSRTIAAGVAHIAAVTDELLPVIADQLTRSRKALDTLVEMTANPSGTAADERQRWGIQNLERDLLPEAEAEFEAAIAIYPYDPLSHYFRGFAITRSGTRPADAASAFATAVRYAKSDNGQLAAGAAMLGAASFRMAGDRQAAQALLREAGDSVPSCPEVWLSLAGTTHDAEDLARALDIEPAYALDAVADAWDCAEDAALIALSRTHANRLTALEEAEGDLRRTAEQLQLSVPSTEASPGTDGAPVSRLIRTIQEIGRRSAALEAVVTAADAATVTAEMELPKPPQDRYVIYPDEWLWFAGPSLVISGVVGLIVHSSAVFFVLFVLGAVGVPFVALLSGRDKYRAEMDAHTRAVAEAEEAHRLAAERRVSIEPMLARARDAIAVPPSAAAERVWPFKLDGHESAADVKAG
jgi:tetratricopeptide (TPR) repeat protein